MKFFSLLIFLSSCSLIPWNSNATEDLLQGEEKVVENVVQDIFPKTPRPSVSVKKF
jgi:hypothetical protein